MERDWETVRRLENWLRVYGPRRSNASPWGRPPFLAFEATLLQEFGYETDDDGKPVRPRGSCRSTVKIDASDAEKVEAALVSEFVPEKERRIIKTFYLATSRQCSSFGRLCRDAGTSRRRSVADLMSAEWLLGNVLRTRYDS